MQLATRPTSSFPSTSSSSPPPVSSRSPMSSSFASLSLHTPPPTQQRPTSSRRRSSSTSSSPSSLNQLSPPSSSPRSKPPVPAAKLSHSTCSRPPSTLIEKGKGKLAEPLPEEATQSSLEDITILENGEPRFVGDLQRIKSDSDEPILKETGRRFVLFPIQYHEVRPVVSLYLSALSFERLMR